jgi:hypothetical protein
MEGGGTVHVSVMRIDFRDVLSSFLALETRYSNTRGVAPITAVLRVKV